MEISVTWRGRIIHVVGLDFAERVEYLQNQFTQVWQGRLKRREVIAVNLDKGGISGAFDGAFALAADKEMVSRTHVAELVIRVGHVKVKQQAFTKYLGDGKSCAVRHEWATLEDCVSVVNGAGGLAVIAHPMRYDLSACAKRNLFDEFKNLGGAGIKSTAATAAIDRLNYALLAERFGMLASAGSDFHRLNDFSGGIFGACPELPENCRPEWAHFSRY